ncbi:hypothetical protein [Emticicia sp. SJ17W-69]|uniref:hypothetical protein n=1 Tax=Emticicia sp. SJ17W-69 TaxID=3421657 RepID=UPI003EBFC724
MTESSKINGHLIEIFYSNWNGKEIIKYDGKIVAERRNLSTFSSINSFKVEEEGEEVVYEIQSLAGIFGHGFAIRRNGIIQVHKP